MCFLNEGNQQLPTPARSTTAVLTLQGRAWAERTKTVSCIKLLLSAQKHIYRIFFYATLIS
jgi:hypothetical protein